MSDIWINAFVIIKSSWTDKEKSEVGELVLKSLREKWHTNHSSDAPKDVDTTYTEITVGTS